MTEKEAKKPARKKKMDPPSVDLWRERYERRSADGSRLIAFVKQQLDAFAQGKDIALAFPTDGRVKDLASILDKSVRKNIDLKTIDHFEDFVGIRVVCLFKKNIDLLDRFIRDNFEVISYEDTSERLSADSFGYQSNHYIVTLPREWQKIPSMMGVNDLKVEVQVRTLSQHMWAAVSHKLQYKSESTVPFELRRSINRASAILELIDIEFDRVIRDRIKYTDTISNDIDKENILNVALVKQILNQSLPEQNFEGDERYDVIFSELASLGVIKVGQLQDIISKNLAAAKRIDKAHFDDDSLHGWSSNDLLARGCYFNHMGLIREIMIQAYGNERVREVMNSRSVS